MKKTILFFVLSVFLLSHIFSEKLNFFTKNYQEILESIEDKTALEQIIILEKLIEKQPDFTDLYLLKAKIEIKIQDYLGAEKTLQQIITGDEDDSPQILQLLGTIYFNLKKYQLAEKHFKKLLDKPDYRETARFYLTMTDPVAYADLKPLPRTEPAAAALQTPDQSSDPENDVNIKELNQLYLEKFPEDKSDFIYLLQRKTVEIIDEQLSHYTIHGVVKINSAKGINYFRNYSLLFNNYEYKPTVIHARTFQPDFTIKEVNRKNIVILDQKESADFYSNRKYIAFPFPDVKEGSMIEFKIKFSPTGQSLSPKFTDQFFFGSEIKTLSRQLVVIHPLDVKLNLETIGPKIIKEEQENSTHRIITLTHPDPPHYDLSNETASLFDISPQVILSAFTSWEEVAKWYGRLFQSCLHDSSPPIPSGLELPAQNPLEAIKKSYQYIQKNIHYTAIELNHSALKPHTAAEILKNKFGDCKDQTLLLIYLLAQMNIKAYPVMVSTLGNGKVYESIANPYFFNHLITYIPVQAGIEKDFYLDTTNRYTPFQNLPFQDQGLKVFVIEDNGKGYFKETPMIDYQTNRIEEYYKINVDMIGKGTIEGQELFNGTFSELFRIKLDNKSEKEKFDFFLNMQKKNYPNTKQEQMQIKGLDQQSGAFEINFQTTAKNLTEVFFDGKQIVKTNINDIKNLFSFPAKTQYAFRKNFLYSYAKKVEFIFPEGYEITEHNLKSTVKENEYLKINFEPSKVADNHFILQYEVDLRKALIDPRDLTEINSMLYFFMNDFNISITLENKDHFDYELFYSQLIEEYEQIDVYKNYLSRLINDKKNSKAREIAQKGVALFNDTSYFHIILSLLYSEEENYSAAENELFLALDKEENNLKIYGYLINLYQNAKMDEKLESILKDANQKFPGNNVIIGEIINYYRRKPDYPTLISILEQTIEQFPDKAHFYQDLGFTYSLLPDFEKAEKAFLKAIELDPKNAFALNNLAWLYCENGVKIQKAIEYAQKACQLKPYNDSFLDTLAEAYFKNKQYDLAIDTIKQAMKVNPNYTYLEQQLKKIEAAKKLSTEKK